MMKTVWNNWFRFPQPSVQQRTPSARWGTDFAAPPGHTRTPQARSGARPSVTIRAPSARWSSGATVAPAQAQTVQVEEVIEETPSTRTFVLASSDDVLRRYRAGQHLTIEVSIDGQACRRCYSLSTAPGAQRPAITVKRVDGGRVSNHLIDQVRPGQTLRVHGLAGAFTIVPDPARAAHHVMIGGGVGITPLISMIEAVLADEPRSRVTLLYGSRSEDEIIFHERLARLAGLHGERLQVVLALDHARARWPGLRGRLTGERVLEALGDRVRDAQFYVCGPAPMMDSVVSALGGAGVDRARIHLERFAYADAGTSAHPDQAYAMRFAGSGRTLRSKPGEPLLQTALQSGISLPYSCQMGGCGQCRIKTSAGSVVMDQPNCLSAAELDAGYILACCSYPSSDLVIENH